MSVMRPAQPRSFARARRPVGRLVQRCLALTLLAAVLGENAPAAEQPGSSAEAKPDQAAVDRAILNGYRRYSATCSHCHGPDGLGSTFAPSLIEQPLPFEPFAEVVNNGRTRGNSVMRGFAGDPNVAPYIADIYTYLQARAEGTVGRGRPARPR
jgi:mono/diheme cytochrome c family protein